MTSDNPQEGHRVELVNVEDEMKNCFIDYAMSVIIGRAIPDVRDGLKPVHRRILYAMFHDENNTSDKAYKKSAKAVAATMGNYHPHGDAAIYDTLTKMAQPFSYRYTLVDGQGNFGSIDGDSPAAMRYTEARLTKTAESLLEDIDKDTVDFIPNFDESSQEPDSNWEDGWSNCGNLIPTGGSVSASACAWLCRGYWHAGRNLHWPAQGQAALPNAPEYRGC